MEEQKCCEFVNENYAEAIAYIQQNLSTVLIAINDNAALNNGDPGLDADTRKQLAITTLEGSGGFREITRNGYQKILDSKCNSECCSSAAEAILKAVKSYTDGATTQLNSVALLDGTQATATSLQDYLTISKASFADDVLLITSTTDCKDGCGEKRKECRRTRYKVECPRRRCRKKRSFKKYSCSISEKDPCECGSNDEH